MADNQTNGLDFERVWGNVEKTAHMMIRKFSNIYGYEYDDLLQEARIECWKALNDYDESQSVKFNTYFFVRLKNRYRKLYQESIRKKEYYNQHRNSKLNDDFIDKFIQSSQKNPLDLIIEEEEVNIIEECIKKLPYPLKRMINLKRKGYETQEIARRLGVSNTVIYSRLRDVRKVLEKGDVEYVKRWKKRWEQQQSKRPHYLNKKDPND